MDLSGRAIESIDAYGIKTHTWYDIAGQPVRTISNYAPGGSLTFTATANIVTDTRSDLGSRPLAVTSYLIPCNGTSSYATLVGFPAGCTLVANTAYDAMGRSTSIVKPDSSWTHTVYTKGGRIDRTSRPGASGQTDSDVAWTASLYDAAGRQTTTVSDFDSSGAAGIAIEGFEGDSSGWDAGGGAYFLTGGPSTISLDNGATPTVHTGTASLLVSAATNQGAEWTLPGAFAASRTYHARAWVHVSTSATLKTYLGVDASSGNSSVTTSVVAGWNQIDFEWTVGTTAPGANTVKLAIVNTAGSAVTFRIDDVSVWDTQPRDATTEPNPANVPSSVTVFDARGKVIESIGAPAAPGDPAPVTASVYDGMGRLTDVTVNTKVSISGHGLGSDTNLSTHYDFDELGRQTDTTDPAGRINHVGYNRLGNAVSGTVDFGDGSHLNITALAAYNSLNEVIATCSANAVVGGCTAANIATSTAAWRYTYDAMGHQTGATPPDNALATGLASTSSSYGLAGAGRPDSVTTGPRTTTYHYDAAGRQYETVETTTGPGTLTTTMTLDCLGRETSISVSGTSTDVLTETYDAVARLTSISRSGNAITTFTYNADGTAASRVDRDGAGVTRTNTFTYTTMGQLAAATLPSGYGSTAYGWKLDGTLASRNWGSTSIAGTYLYDGAKRPISLSIHRNGQGADDVLTRTYDVVGNATSESQILGGVTTTAGLAGSGTQTFLYDAARRLIEGYFGPSGNKVQRRTYTYDADSNRTSVTEAGITFYYFYDATDALIKKGPNSDGTGASAFVYDSLGQLTTSQPSAPGSGSISPTTYTYDPAGHLVSIAATGSPTVSFSSDALGRHWVQTVGSDPATTYAYLGTGDSIASLSVAGGATTYSAIDAIGNRLATSAGGAIGYVVADLHGNVVAGIEGGSNPAFLSAFRYDAYGETVDSYNAAGNSLAFPWRFQGRILESATSATDLYDFTARSYDPSLGAFTSFDSVAGSAQNPLSLNRYLYATANPATLIDPDGHWPWDDVAKAASDVASAAANTVSNVATSYAKTVSNVANTVTSAASSAATFVSENASTITHATLGVASFVPGLGVATSLLDAGLYAAEGDYMSAGLSLAGAVPGGALLKYGGKMLRAGADIEKGVKIAGNLEKADKLITDAERAQSVIRDAEKGESIAVDAEKAATGAEKAKGGVYTLRDGDKVVYTGRSKDLARRKIEQFEDPEKGKYEFRVEHRTDVYAEQRGLEQHVYDLHGGPPLNKIRPISLRNRNFDLYMSAAHRYLKAV
jgi:RHS repeat-associated protein